MQDARLPFHLKFIFGLGDHSINVALVALTMVFPFYLTDVVEMRPWLAGLVPLVGRSVDAVSDVWMGRLSDRTRWKAGRRRPFLLIGALPFAISFAAIWSAPTFEGDVGQFVFYAGVYALISVSMTVCAIPYYALMPDLTDSYDERTALVTFRSALSLIGTLMIAVLFRPLVDTFGGDAPAWAMTGAVFAAWIVWPWVPIWWVTWERPPAEISDPIPLRKYLDVIRSNVNFARLLGLFALGRIAIDLPLALFLHYFTYVIGQPDYFDGMMFSFILGTVVAMPLWLRFARGRDKAQVYRWACVGWTTTFLGLLTFQPGWPYEGMIAVSLLSGFGYAAADMMPWSMVADIADEDELSVGERREGVFMGIFTFVRKISGATGVFVGLFVLDVVGFQPNVENTDAVLYTIRALTAGVPILFILWSLAIATRYTLSRRQHDAILGALEARRGERTVL
ncbi:MAG: glycoside-pentoside-hexuronide (GPH):cation symporter [Myxococcota bacterium]